MCQCLANARKKLLASTCFKLQRMGHSSLHLWPDLLRSQITSPKLPHKLKILHVLLVGMLQVIYRDSCAIITGAKVVQTAVLKWGFLCVLLAVTMENLGAHQKNYSGRHRHYLEWSGCKIIQCWKEFGHRRGGMASICDPLYVSQLAPALQTC